MSEWPTDEGYFAELASQNGSLDDAWPDAPLGTWTPPGIAQEPPPEPFALTLNDFINARGEGRPALLGTDDDAVLPAAGLALIAGRPGAGKTTLALDLAFHLAAGRDWLGIPVPEPLRVLVIENEGPREPFRRKLEHKRDSWGQELPGALYVHTLRWGAFTLADDDGSTIADLRALVAHERIDVCIADPLTTLGVRGVGSPADTRDFLALATRAGLFRDLALVLLHHFRHGSTRGDAAADELDELSGAWGGHADAVLVVKDADGDRARLSFPKLRWANPRRPLILARHRDTATFEAVAEEGTTAGRDLEGEVLAHLAAELAGGEKNGWRTLTEIARPKDKGGIGRNRDDLAEVLERLTREGEIEYAEGPPGRGRDAKCWRLLDRPSNPEQPPCSDGAQGGLLDTPSHTPRGVGGVGATPPHLRLLDEPSNPDPDEAQAELDRLAAKYPDDFTKED